MKNLSLQNGLYKKVVTAALRGDQRGVNLLGSVEKDRQQRSRIFVVLTYSRTRSARQKPCGLAGPGSAEAATRRQAAFLNTPP